MKYTREGGFRSRLIARLTNGRFGLGRWTLAELKKIEADAEAKWKDFNRWVQ